MINLNSRFYRDPPKKYFHWRKNILMHISGCFNLFLFPLVMRYLRLTILTIKKLLKPLKSSECYVSKIYVLKDKQIKWQVFSLLIVFVIFQQKLENKQVLKHDV